MGGGVRVRASVGRSVHGEVDASLRVLHTWAGPDGLWLDPGLESPYDWVRAGAVAGVEIEPPMSLVVVRLWGQGGWIGRDGLAEMGWTNESEGTVAGERTCDSLVIVIALHFFC